MTYDDDECHPSLHIHVMSKHHEVSIDSFELDAESIGLNDPQHLPMMLVENQLSIVRGLHNHLKRACEFGLQNKLGDKPRNKLMKKEVLKFAKELKGLASKSDGSSSDDSSKSSSSSSSSSSSESSSSSSESSDDDDDDTSKKS